MFFFFLKKLDHSPCLHVCLEHGRQDGRPGGEDRAVAGDPLVPADQRHVPEVVHGRDRPHVVGELLLSLLLSLCEPLQPLPRGLEAEEHRELHLAVHVEVVVIDVEGLPRVASTLGAVEFEMIKALTFIFVKRIWPS